MLPHIETGTQNRVEDFRGRTSSPCALRANKVHSSPHFPTPSSYRGEYAPNPLPANEMKRQAFSQIIGAYVEPSGGDRFFFPQICEAHRPSKFAIPPVSVISGTKRDLKLDKQPSTEWKRTEKARRWINSEPQSEWVEESFMERNSFLIKTILFVWWFGLPGPSYPRGVWHSDKKTEFKAQ